MEKSAPSCGQCAHGWRCLDHPDQPAGHDGCDGAHVACRHPDCPPVTHIHCLACKRPVGVVSYHSTVAMSFECPACGHTWNRLEAPVRDQSVAS